jgi:glycosyltransferase involved in cell wall biosynthesis
MCSNGWRTPHRDGDRRLPADCSDVNRLGAPVNAASVGCVTPERPTLSVVIPARNEEAFLGPCLDALGAQRDPADEIIVVDNDSADATAVVAARPGVMVVAEPRRGITYARNTGMDAATGDLIARIDADTVVTPGWAEAIRRAFATTPELAALAGPAGFTRLSHGDHVVGRGAYEFVRAAHRVTIGMVPVMYGHNMALRRSAWAGIRDTVTVGDDAISEDLDVTLALVHGGKRIGYEPEMLVTIGVERTLQYRKLSGYRRTNQLTMAKYRTRRDGAESRVEQR